MKKVIYLLLGFLLFSCTNSSKTKIKNIENVQNELLSFLNDSINIFEKVEEVEINGFMENERMSLHFYSISKDVFFDAIKRNEKNLRYFTSDFKLNESVGSIDTSKLKLSKNINLKSFCEWDDAFKMLVPRSIFFLENIIGNYYIIQAAHIARFGDESVIFWNSQTEYVDLWLYGLPSCSREKDSLVFHTRYPIIFYGDEIPVSFLKITENKIDTLFSGHVNWHATLSFFDIEENSLFFIYNYDYYNDKSTFVKLDFIINE